MGAYALTIVACLLPDKGSQRHQAVIYAFGSPESLLTRCDLMANPTPASRRSSFLRPQRRKCSQHQRLSKALLLQGESHSVTFYRSSSQPTRVFLYEVLKMRDMFSMEQLL